ncbi:MFS general substrate transporter [Tothia fuscella]|uniref:MFS general substrate transporter n=1 Tax=Tothia fuscella TaxID=1048955 RepID=A0A9P4NV12_9PEZI|nr:MFS general substrate transporter [Tothia fuscella]
MSSETSPLLPAPDDGVRTHNSEPTTLARSVGSHIYRWRALYLCGLFTLVVDFTEFMRIAISARLLEDRICRAHYSRYDPGATGPGGSVPEEMCKIPPVQSELAKTHGVLGVLIILPGLILPVPYGILADHWGRRLVAMLGLIGIVLAELWYYIVMTFDKTFPIWAIYFGPLSFLIGGGGGVLAAAMLAIVADHVPNTFRTRIFFLLQVVVLVSELFAPAVGSQLLKHLPPNLAYLCGIPPYGLAMAILSCISEGKNTSAGSKNDAATNNSAESSSPPKSRYSIKHQLVGVRDHMMTDILPLLKRKIIILALVSTVVVSFARPVFGILIQYMGVRFHWKFEDSAYLLSFQASVNIFLLCLVLPFISAWLTKRYDNDPDKSNLVLAQCSIIFIALGPLIVAFAPDVWAIFLAILVSTLGSGFGGSLRSFMTSMVAKDEITLLYTLMTVFGSLGALIGAPLMALTFAKAINLGGFWLGLPFFIASAMFAISGISLWSITCPPKPTEDEHEELI